MLFGILASDIEPNGLAIREATKDKHLDYIRSLGDKIKFSGPLMTDDGSSPNDTTLVASAASIKEAKIITEKDPYAQAGLFDRVQVRSWNWTVGSPENAK